MQRQGDTFIKDITEEEKTIIDDYRLTHPDIEGRWLKYEYSDKIPLNDINIIMEPTPIIRGRVSYCNAHIMESASVIRRDVSYCNTNTDEEDNTKKGLSDSSSANFYVTPQNPEKELVMLLEQEIDCENKNGRKYVNISELINWIEKKKSIYPNFVYSLKKPFVEYYRKRHEVKSYDDLKAEILSLQKRCACLEK